MDRFTIYDLAIYDFGGCTSAIFLVEQSRRWNYFEAAKYLKKTRNNRLPVAPIVNRKSKIVNRPIFRQNKTE
jgi:hypothetical protein